MPKTPSDAQNPDSDPSSPYRYPPSPVPSPVSPTPGYSLSPDFDPRKTILTTTGVRAPPVSFEFVPGTNELLAITRRYRMSSLVITHVPTGGEMPVKDVWTGRGSLTAHAVAHVAHNIFKHYPRAQLESSDINVMIGDITQEQLQSIADGKPA